MGSVISAMENNPRTLMMATGLGFFTFSYLIAIRIAPAPNDNLNYLLGSGAYVDVTTGQTNQTQLASLSHTESTGDKISNFFNSATTSKPTLITNPATGSLGYLINGVFYSPAEVASDIDNRTIPDAWGTGVDMRALRDEIARSHSDVNGNPIVDPSKIPTAQNVSSYNNPDKIAATENKSYVMSEGAKQFADYHADLVAQAYPNKPVTDLTDDDIVHVFNMIYVGAADRRKTTDGEATRVDIAKWVNFYTQNNSRLLQYETAIRNNNQKWKTQVDKGRFDDRVGLQNQLVNNGAGTANVKMRK